MIVFIDDILNGDISELLGADLYAETISKIVVWWSVLPMIGIILLVVLAVLSMFRSRNMS